MPGSLPGGALLQQLGQGLLWCHAGACVVAKAQHDSISTMSAS